MVSLVVDEHLMLRTYTREDARELLLVVDKNRAHLRPWLTWVDTTTRPEHSLEFIERYSALLHNQEGIALGIFYDGHIVGGLGMDQWNHQLRKASIGYWIAKEYEGKGILSKCLTHFLNFSFEQLRLNKIEIHFIAANSRSATIAKRFGAKIEGVLRDSYLLNGKLEDLIIAGILISEWKVD